MITTELPPRLEFTPSASVDEMMSGGPSSLGWTNTSTFLTCPEQARLRALGVKPRSGEVRGLAPMNPLGFGLLMHELLATRIVHGHIACEEALARMEGLHPEDSMKALNCMRIYDDAYPFEHEPWSYLAVEAQVNTFFDGVLRTVRYDAIVMPPDRTGVYSLEHKTTSRAGLTAMSAYTGQFMVQTAIWNANDALVRTYGKMLGVIADTVVKTVVPQVERIGPFYFSSLQQQRALEYMALTDKIKFPINPDGTYPRFLHSCWGKFGPCAYIDLCHHDAQGSYTWPEKEAA